jgi:hypothetical protein
VVKSAQSDKLVRQHTDKAEWKLFLKAHSEITDDLINDTNKSTAGSPSHKLSLSHDSDSGEVLDTEDAEENEDAGDLLPGVRLTVLLLDLGHGWQQTIDVLSQHRLLPLAPLPPSLLRSALAPEHRYAGDAWRHVLMLYVCVCVCVCVCMLAQEWCR